MSRDYRLYLDDILDSTHKALTYTQGLAFEQFLSFGTA